MGHLSFCVYSCWPATWLSPEKQVMGYLLDLKAIYSKQSHQAVGITPEIFQLVPL